MRLEKKVWAEYCVGVLHLPDQATYLKTLRMMMDDDEYDVDDDSFTPSCVVSCVRLLLLLRFFPLLRRVSVR